MLFSILLAQATAAVNAAGQVTQDAAQKVVESNVVDTANAAATKSVSIFSHIGDSDPLVKLVLLLLVGFSITCWAIIFLKFGQIGKAQRGAQNFWQKFSSAATISDVMTAKSLRNGPIFEIFASGTETLGKLRKVVNGPSDYSRSLLQQRMNQAREEELHKLEQYVPFLATTASVAPFIGLLGTVWGILSAFMQIGQSGSSSLATVGPFIAEALVATAVGLFAAIPAVIGYNYYVGKIRVIRKLADLFMADFILKSDKELVS